MHREFYMKPVERNKVQKLVSKIETGSFDENDIDGLFMKLRAYSAGFPVFREIADFVAHNDIRDRGVANQSLETMYLRMKFFLEYNSPKKNLDLGTPFPLWIMHLMKYQVEKTEESVLREKFNVTRKRLLSRIDNGFKVDKKNKVAIFREGKLSEQTFEAIQHVMSFISGKPAFSQSDLVNELIGVMNKNSLDFDEHIIQTQADKLTICTLLLFHHAEFDYKGFKPGLCKISSEKESISHNTRFVDSEGNEVEHHESYGNLSIKGCVTLESDGKELSVAHDVMSTDLNVEEWCTDSLFHIEPMSEQAPDYMCKRLKLDVDLALNEDFKLTAVRA
jgi:hypothetical protein